jgi:hypothetical protein
MAPKLAVPLDDFIFLPSTPTSRLDLLSIFQGLSVVGMVWNMVNDDYELSDDERIDEEREALEKIHKFWKIKTNWAVKEIPELRLLDASGNLVERRKRAEPQQSSSAA